MIREYFALIGLLEGTLRTETVLTDNLVKQVSQIS